MSGIDEAIDQITQIHDARYEAVEVPHIGGWVATIETDGWFVRGEGPTEEMAKGALIKNAKAEGRA